jgi:hypothetical protein
LSTKRPAGVPLRIPRWAWRRLHKPSSHPHLGPKKLPNWFWRWRAYKLHLKIPKLKKPPLSKGEIRRNKIIVAAHSIVGIHEEPPHSNSGPGVHVIQSATGAYNTYWCVSTVQYIWKKAGLGTWANSTAGAYYLAEYAAEHGCVTPKPVAGCAVVYHIGNGHAGTVVDVNKFTGTFTAIEGNEADAVRLVQRNPRSLRCTFILRPELR